jgi:MFS family permease
MACQPVVFSGIQSVCGPGRRAFATALMLSLINVLGVIAGPLLTGVLSDYFSSSEGVLSLRTAITAVLWLLLPSAAMIWAAGRWLRRDMEP